MEDQEIRIIVKDGKLSLKRYVNDEVKEQYRPESKEVVHVWITSIFNGFNPPKILSNLDDL